MDLPQSERAIKIREKINSGFGPASQVTNEELADAFAEQGTVKHFALRLGYMPHDEEAAEAILTKMIKAGEKVEL